MLKAVKANKEYTITEELKQRYLEDGYDIYDDKGNIVAYSPKKKIEYSKYAEIEKQKTELLKENKKLKEEISKLKKDAKGEGKTSTQDEAKADK